MARDIALLRNPYQALEEYQELIEDAKLVVAHAKGPKDPQDGTYDLDKPGLMLAAIESIGRNLERQIKVAKEIHGMTEGMVPVAAFKELTRTILEALKPYPEARAAVQQKIKGQGRLE